MYLKDSHFLSCIFCFRRGSIAKVRYVPTEDELISNLGVVGSRVASGLANLTACVVPYLRRNLCLDVLKRKADSYGTWIHLTYDYSTYLPSSTRVFYTAHPCQARQC